MNFRFVLYLFLVLAAYTTSRFLFDSNLLADHRYLDLQSHWPSPQPVDAPHRIVVAN